MRSGEEVPGRLTWKLILAGCLNGPDFPCYMNDMKPGSEA